MDYNKLKKGLANQGYVPLLDRKYEITDDNGSVVGKIGYRAVQAIENGNIDNYKAQNQEEEKALSYLRASFRNDRENRDRRVRANYANLRAERENDSSVDDVEAYEKYAIRKESDISGINNNTKLLGGSNAQFAQSDSVKRNLWDKIVEGYGNLLPKGSEAKKSYNKATDFKNESLSLTDDAYADLAVKALHSGDNVNHIGFEVVNEAYEVLSNSQKYKDSDLVKALREAKKSWTASPLQATGINTWAAVTGMGSDIANFTNMLGADKIPGVKNINDFVIEYADKQAENASKYNKGTLGEARGSLTQGVVNLIPYIAIAIASGGSSVAASGAKTALSSSKYAPILKQIASNPSFWYSFVSSTGDKYDEASKKGADRKTATLNAVAYGLPAALIEQSSGFGSTKKDPLWQEVGGEVLEELSQNVVSGLADKITSNPELPFYSHKKGEEAIVNPTEMAETAAMTVPITVIGGGMSNVAGKTAVLAEQKYQMHKANTDKKVMDTALSFANSLYEDYEGSVDNSMTKSEINRLGKIYKEDSRSLKDLVNEGLESPTDTTSYKIANSINEKMEKNKKLSNNEVGQLVEATIKQTIAETSIQSTLSPEVKHRVVLNRDSINNARVKVDKGSMSEAKYNENIIRETEKGINSLNDIIDSRISRALGKEGLNPETRKDTQAVTSELATSESGVANIDNLRSYARAYVNTLRATNEKVFKDLDSRTDNIAEAIIEAVVGGNSAHITETLRSNPTFDRAVNNFKKTISGILSAKDSFRSKYGFVVTPEAVAQTDSVKNGDFSSFMATNNTTTPSVEATAETGKNKATNDVVVDGAITFVQDILGADTLSNNQVDRIISTPALNDAFTRLSGVKIQGTKTEQRAIVRNWYNDYKAKQATTDSVSPEIKPIVDAMTETFKEGAVEDIYEKMEKNGLKGDIGVFAEKIRNFYYQNNSLGKFAGYFVDDGKKVAAVMDEQRTDIDDIVDVVEETVEKPTKVEEPTVAVAKNATTNTNTSVETAPMVENTEKTATVEDQATREKTQNIVAEKDVEENQPINEYSISEDEEIGTQPTIKQNEYGYELNGLPSDTELVSIANDVVDGAVVTLKGNDNINDATLIYEDNVNAEKVIADIKAYYNDNIIPDNAFNDDLPWEDVKFSIENKTITNEDVEAIRSIGRKSINDFTSDDIKKSENWAKKFFSEIGTKSPFFRNWFGDWRAEDTSRKEIVIAENVEGKNPRGTFINADTGWSINSSSVGYDETVSHSGKDKMSLIAMRNIDKIIQNAVLLDSEVSEYGRGKKSIYTAFMHKFYAIVKIDSKPYIAKMTVDESYNPGHNDTNKKFYHVRAIKIEPLSSVGIGLNHTPIMDGKNSTISVSELFDFVKEYDKDFNPKPVSVVVNEDGTPKVMYRGDENMDFTIFDRKKSRASNLYGRGFYFTDSESAASAYGKPYSFYLNIKNPLSPGFNQITKQQLIKFLEAVAANEDAYDIWNYGTTDINAIADSLYGKGDFEMLQDVSATAIGDLVEAIEMFNRVNGTSYDGIITKTETVVFNSSQIKSATDNIGTFDEGNDDIRFSFSDNVEETKDLIAVHNLSADKLLKALNLGGFPMPSIAITRAEEGYPNFGDISVVFGKDTINPEGDLANKVYSGDAWTPTYPRLEYKANEDKIKEINNLYYEVMRKFGSNDAYPLYSYAYTDMAEEKLDRKGGENAVISELKEDTDLMQTFFLINGEEKVAPIEKEIVTKISDSEKEQYDYLISKVGKDFFEKSKTPEGTSPLGFARKYFKENGSVLENAFKDMLSDVYGFNQNEQSNVLKQQNEFTYVQLIRKIRGYIENGDTTVRTEVDNSATKEAIRKKAEKLNFNEWVEKTFKGIAEKQGIANQKDPYTPSGNRRSFDELHYEYNLENVVRAMMESGEKGIGGFGGGNVFGAATENYNSINDIKQNAKKRMNNIPESKFEEMREEFRDRLFDIARLAAKNEETSTFAITDVFTEAIAKHKTRDSIARYLESELEGWANYSDDITDKLIQIVSEIREMPAGYFEAKPQRAVGFDEVKAVIMPAQYSYEEDLSELKTMLDEMNVPVIEYEYGDNESRRKALNSVEDVRFSNDNTIESEVNEDEQGRSNSLSGDSGRRGNGGSGERIRRVSENERRNQGRDEEERRSFARELREQGKVQTVTEKIGRYTYRYDVVSPESYNDDMLSMIAEAAEKGIELGFFVGNGNVNYDSKGDFKIDGIKVSGSKILVQYDAKISPQKIAKHEIVHAKWKTTEIKNIAKAILSQLSDAEKKTILSQGRYRRYLKIYRGNVNAVFEEFVCDVMAGMNDYGVKFNDIVNEYWNSQETDIETYSPAEYAESIDAGDDGKKFSAAEERDVENGRISVGMSDDTRARLLNKKSVNIVSFDAEKTKVLDGIDIDALQKTLTRHAKPIIEKVANEFGILNKTYFNPDIELDFGYSRGSLKESMNKQHTMYGDFVKMLSVFPDVIKNAVGVETHKDKYAGTTREDASLKQMYVLISAFSDDTGIIPIKLEVKEFNDKANKLYLSVVLTKKESRYPHGNLEQSPLNTATPASAISIADLVDIVNPSEGDFLKYFPNSMLDREQIESKNQALAKDVDKIEKLKKSGVRFSISQEQDDDYLKAVESGDVETAQKMVDEAAKANGYRINGHHGTDKRVTIFDINKTNDANDFGQGIYFTSSEIEAKRYQSDDSFGDTYNKIYNVAYDNALEIIEENGEDANDDNIFTPIFNDEFDKELKRRIDEGVVINAYLKMDNPFVVSASNWITKDEAIEIAKNTMYAENAPDEIVIADWIHSIESYAKHHDGKIDTDQFANKMGHAINLTNALLHQGKYDGILDYTIRDKFNSTSDYHAIVLYPNKVKDSSPVTYDDDGNIIPLSERFNEDNNDIRYSFSNDSDTNFLSKPIKKIKRNINEIRLRAEIKKGKVYSQSDVREVASAMLNNIKIGNNEGLVMSKGDKAVLAVLVNRVLNESNGTSPTAIEKQETNIKRLAAFIAQKAKVYESFDNYDYKGELKELKNNVIHSIALTDSDKETLDSIGASGYKAVFGGGKDGVDVIYSNLSSQNPDQFPMDTNATDIKLKRIVEMYNWLKEGAQISEERLIDILSEDEKRDFVELVHNEVKKALGNETLGRDSKTDAIKKRLGKKIEAREKQILDRRVRDILMTMKKNVKKDEKKGGYPKEVANIAQEAIIGLNSPDGIDLSTFKMAYDTLKDSGDYSLSSEYSEDLSDMIGRLHQGIKGKKFNSLNSTELSMVKDVLSELRHRLYSARKQIGIAKAKENAEIASQIINDIKKNGSRNQDIRKQILKEIKFGNNAIKAFLFNPTRINEIISGYNENSEWAKLFDQLRRGSRKADKFLMDATKPFDTLTSGAKNEIEYYDFRTELFDTGIKYIDGTEVKIPKSIICELVMAWDRKEGRQHLEVGGATIPDVKKYNQGKTYQSIHDYGKRTRAITQNDIDRLKNMLDKYDQEWIKKARHLFDNVTKGAINETSMQLLGRELANVPNYIRLYVDEDLRNREIRQKYNPTLEGHGSLKETVEGAVQPIVLRGLQENVYDQIDFVSKYYGLAIPIRNFNKVYNSKLGIGDNILTVSDVLSKEFGSDFRNGVIEQMIVDLQSPRFEENNIILKGWNKVRMNWLNATFFANLKSTLKQTTSYWTAASILDEDSLVKGMSKYLIHAKKTKAEIEKYSGTLYKRSQGLSTTELGDRANAKRLAGASKGVTRFINKHLPILRKIPEGLRPQNWLQAMDVNTSAALWEACKADVAKRMEPESQGYMKAVADLYEKVIEETQSNYDILHRPEALKTTNPVVKTFMMFQNDNLQQTGLIYSAYGNLKAKSAEYKQSKTAENEKSLEEAKRRFAKSIRARVYSSLYLAFMNVLGAILLRKFNPLIDDDEKEITAGSVLEYAMEQIVADMIGVFMPLFGDVILKAFDTFSKGYDFANDPSIESVQEFIEATSKIYQKVSEEDYKGAWDAVVKAIPAISNITGVPIKNITDLFKAAVGYAKDIKLGDFAHDISSYADGFTYKDLASSIVSDNKEKEEKISKWFAEEKGLNKSSLTKAIKPAYVTACIEDEKQAKKIKNRLVLEYDYDEDTVDNWLIAEYMDNAIQGKAKSDGSVSDTEYASNIASFIKKSKEWNSDNKAIKSGFKSMYEECSESERKELKKALAKSGIKASDIKKWAEEAEDDMKAEKEKAEKKKDDFKKNK